MAAAVFPEKLADAVTSEPESEGLTSRASTPQRDAHNAAAEKNRAKKAANKKKMVAKRKADRVFTMPESSNVSNLQVSLEEAKKKRDDVKREVAAESHKVKLARKRVERVKTKAKILSNNDLYEVFLIRMEEDKKRKEKKAARNSTTET